MFGEKSISELMRELYDFKFIDKTFGDGLFSAIGLPILPDGDVKNHVLRSLSEFYFKSVGLITIYDFPYDMKSEDMKRLIEEIEGTAKYNHKIDVFVVKPPQQHWIEDPEKGRIPVGDDPNDKRERLKEILLELNYERRIYPNRYDLGVRYIKKL